MTITTKSFDDADYVLVPRTTGTAAMRDAEPTDLPGVVTHSGKPVAIIDESDDGLFADLIVGDDGITVKVGNELFTHADPAEVEQLRQRVAELTSELTTTRTHISCSRRVADMRAQINELEAQLAQQDGAQSSIVELRRYAMKPGESLKTAMAALEKVRNIHCLVAAEKNLIDSAYADCNSALSYFTPEVIAPAVRQQDGAQPIAFLRENLRIELNPLVKFDYPAGTAAAIKIPLYTHPASQPATRAARRSAAHLMTWRQMFETRLRILRKA